MALNFSNNENLQTAFETWLKHPSVWANSGVWHDWRAFILLALSPFAAFGELCISQDISLASPIAFNFLAFSTFEALVNSKKSYVNKWVQTRYEQIHAGNSSLMFFTLFLLSLPLPLWLPGLTKGFKWTNLYAIRAPSPRCTHHSLQYTHTYTKEILPAWQ